MKRFFLSLSPCLLVSLSLAVIGCTQDKTQPQIQQLQQQLKTDEATLAQLQQQQQADQALIKQIQQELSELHKRRNSPCPDCPAEAVAQLRSFHPSTLIPHPCRRQQHHRRTPASKLPLTG
jgi:hypothetical protein